MSIINEALKKAEKEQRPLPVGLVQTRWEEKPHRFSQTFFLIFGAFCSSLLLVFTVYYWYFSPVTQTPVSTQTVLESSVGEQNKRLSDSSTTALQMVKQPQGSLPPDTSATPRPIKAFPDSSTTALQTKGESIKKEQSTHFVSEPHPREPSLVSLQHPLKQTPPVLPPPEQPSRPLAQESVPVDFYFQEGVIRQKSGDWEGAIEAFQKALALNDQLFSVRNNLGNAYFHLGRYEEARREYMMAIQLNPSYAKAHNNLGNALVKLGEIEEALQVFRTAIDLDPLYATPYYNLGALYARKGEREKALAALRKAIALNRAVKEWLREDTEEYRSLQNNEEFQALLR